MKKGATSVFVKKGTYYETKNVIIPSYGQLIGEVQSKTVIAFIGTFGVIVDGSSGIIVDNGTISIVTNTYQVTGVGTTFATSLVPGKYIQINTEYFEIKSIESETSLTIKTVFNGHTVTNAPYIAQSMKIGCKVANLTIFGSSGIGCYMRSIRNSTMNNVCIMSCLQGVTVEYCSNISIETIISLNNITTGIALINSMLVSGNACVSINNITHGLLITGPYSLNILLKHLSMNGNKGNGIYITDGKFIQIGSSIINNNILNGILIDNLVQSCNLQGVFFIQNLISGVSSSALNSEIDNCVFKSNNVGINITSNNNMISVNQLSDNTTGIFVSSSASNVIVNNNIIVDNIDKCIIIEGDMCSITGNKLITSMHGITLYGSKHIINSNSVSNMTEDGIIINNDNNIITGNLVNSCNNGIIVQNTANKTLITGNNSQDNTTNNFVDNGTSSVNGNNIFV